MSTRIRPALVSVATLAAVTSVGLIAPAAVAAPTLPDGCTFDQTTGTSTCTTTSVATTKTETSANPGGDAYFDDSSLFYVLCKSAEPRTTAAQTFGNGNVSTAVAQTTTVKTTSYQGVATGKGNKPISTTTKTTKTVSLLDDNGNSVNILCLYPAPQSGSYAIPVGPGYSIVVG